jgi:SNF2 family DNA or RNA helicase
MMRESKTLSIGACRIVNRGGHVYAFFSPKNDAIWEVCKSIPGIRWSKLHRACLGYRDAMQVLRDRLHDELEIFVSWQEPQPMPSPFAICYESLRDYQRTGVEFLVEHAREGCILADDMGLGKTCQATRAARAFKEKTVVVCPSFVKGVWEVELKKWWPSANVVTASGTKPDAALLGLPVGDGVTDDTAAVQVLANGGVQVVIVNFDIMHAWADLLVKWGARTLIIDELHYMMTATSRRSESVRKVAEVCTQRMGLTGTPKPSHVKNLWSAVEILSPGRFGDSFWNFGIRYCDGHQEGIEIFEDGIKATRNIWKWDGSSNEAELAKRLSFFMLRRLKSDVNLQLPKVQRQVIELEVKRAAPKPSAWLMNDRAFRKSLDIAADQKVPQLIDMVAGYVASGRKVVFTSYRKVIAQAIHDGVRAKMPIRSALITGETPQKKRHEIIKTQPDLLCCTMDSCGVGVSLAYASVLVFGELHYVPSTLMQMEARLPRPDSTSENVLVVYAVARGTADSIVKRIVLSKLTIDEKVIGKSTSKLFDDLNTAAKTSVSEKMKRIYERILAEEVVV